jgi:hypothetical protein
MPLKKYFIDRNKNISGCPVCGYPDFVAFEDKLGVTTYEICPCCGVQSGYEYGEKATTDDFSRLRQKWISERGGAWWSNAHKQPEGWDHISQMTEAGLLRS